MAYALSDETGPSILAVRLHKAPIRLSSFNVLENISAEYDGALEAAHAQIDYDRFDVTECCAACQPFGFG